jgi:hypothetical protein
MQNPDRPAKLVGLVYGGKGCRAGVSKVVHTPKLQGTMGCHIKLMKIATNNEER